MKQPGLFGISLPAVILALAAGVLAGQNSAASKDNPLTYLMDTLSQHTQTPAQVLDPAADPSSRTRSLDRLTDPRYELSLEPIGSVSVPAGATASVPVRVRFKTASEELNANATAEFVKRGGIWYFADFEFLATPTLLIVVAVVGVPIGVAYAAFVLVLRSRLAKHGELSLADRLRLFIPLYWPSLLRRTSR